MKNNIRSLIFGFIFTAIGVALAVTIPNNFSSGEVISSSKVNANFAALKTAVDALEAKQSFAFEYTVPAGTTTNQFVLENSKLNNDPNWIVTVTLKYQGEGYDDVNQGFGVYYVSSAVFADGPNKWAVNYFKPGQNLSGRKFFVTASRP
jgi:hypothetical protein